MNENELTIIYSDILERCKMLSSYEGRDRYDANGTGIYEKVIITEQDEPLINSYLSQSLLALRERLEDMIEAVDDTTAGQETWTMKFQQKRYDSKGYKGLVTHLGEALASSVMTAWLNFVGVQDRASFYQTVYENEAKLISDNLHTKAAPARPQ
jgi:hypothetical protein